MNILHIMPDFELAGAQTMCENLVQEINKNNDYKVDVVSFFDKKTEITERLIKSGINVFFLSKRKGLDLSIFFKLFKIIRKTNPDVIHSHRYVLQYLFPILLFKRIKTIHTVHNVAEKEVPKRLQHIQKILFKKKIVIPVAISEMVKKSICELYDMNENDVPIIYNGVDFSKCHKSAAGTKKIILNIGRFAEQKNHKEMIEIFEECLKIDSKIKLILVGNGPLKEEIKNYAKNKRVDENIIFIDSIESSYELLSKVDLFIMTSKWEGMPMSIIEAMGSGVPCVAYPVGGIPDMINDGIDGFLPKNKEEFVGKVMKLINEESVRLHLGKNASINSQKFSSIIMAEKYIKLYNNERDKLYV